MKVTIVAAYNTQVEMTLQFLETLESTTKDFLVDNEIYMILVNGGSPIDIKHSFVDELVHLDKNIGFSVTVNAGLSRVPEDSDYILYMGNDSFPNTDDWLEGLIDLQQQTGAGIVCPMNDRPGMAALSHCHKDEHATYFDCLFYPSIVYLISKECFDKVGLWDTAFINSGMYGDNDYCIRVNMAGFKIIISKYILLNHLLSQEAPRLFDVNKDMQYNEKVLKDKWGIDAN